MKLSPVELRNELASLESRQRDLTETIARLTLELAEAKKQLLELEGSRYSRGKIDKKKTEILEAEDCERVEKSPLARWTNAEAIQGITIYKVTAKRIYLRKFDERYLSDELIFSRETGKAVSYYSSSKIDPGLTLDVPATLKAWNIFAVTGGANT